MNHTEGVCLMDFLPHCHLLIPGLNPQPLAKTRNTEVLRTLGPWSPTPALCPSCGLYLSTSCLACAATNRGHFWRSILNPFQMIHLQYRWGVLNHFYAMNPSDNLVTIMGPLLQQMFLDT